ncbi:hypothetical protein BDN72DRAFT_862307 [Pluteus cervinus]|uniref:Uncharacterized protein n=1 Tax=Pluteus cervinus TaxID=181527 RepID=A0ACD3AC71_9AGAR|nr:hypothetical protein BDN72DRAFT_862307 [Pluteus cervinus]
MDCPGSGSYFHLYEMRFRLPSATRSEPNADAPILWPQLSKRLKKEWKRVRSVSRIIFSLNVALLQVNGITSREVTSTTTALSLWLAFASFVCACINILYLSPMQETYEDVLDETYEDVLDRTKSRTLMFWVLWIVMTLPTSFAIWSSVSFVLTLAVYTFSGASNGPGSVGATTDRPAVSVVLVLIGLIMLTYLPVLVLRVPVKESHPSPGSIRAEAEVNTEHGST